MDDHLIAHVGFHKTGSTLLQTKLLKPEYGFHSPWHIKYHFQQIVRADPYGDRVVALRKAYREELEVAKTRSLVPAISHEALLGNPFDGGNRFASTRYVEELAHAFPRLVVVGVIREQESMIASLYKHSISAAHTWSLQSFLPREQGSKRSFGMEFLDYARPFLRLRDILGPDRVKVIPYEWMRSNPESFVGVFESLAGTLIPSEIVTAKHVNTGLTALEAGIKRHGNRMLPNAPGQRSAADVCLRRVSRTGAAVLGKRAEAAHEAHLRTYIKGVVGQRYAESNSRLAAATGLDLNDLGYNVE